MAIAQSHDDEVLSEMNVTPLVDVMLVLLVVFIVTAPLMTNALTVNLPKTGAVAPPETLEPLIVTVDADHRYFLDEREHELEALEQALRQAHAARPERAAQLQADESVAYGHVARALAALQRAGIQKIAMITAE
ncbi:MAG: biopolymer transporter ExbD [Pseudomonadota bacterium]|nr:biopolymer transporter ExbD [Pseudomonadota bacterium]HJO36309.1 biopolymer transporter ExbD [Gammaproteobacteria bacterium]